MTSREAVHNLVDAVPDQDLENVLDYLAQLCEGEDYLDSTALVAVEEARDDYRFGRTIPLEEYRRTRLH